MKKIPTLFLQIWLIFILLVSSAAADFQRTKIAVLDFEIIGDELDTAGMGAILSEWFITSIVQSGRFDVVERALLQKIIAEQKLSATGLIDSNSASELGKILGVEVIISGSLLRIRNTIDINSRVINVQSGSIIAAESIRGNTSEDYHNLVERLTAKIMRNFPLTGYIVKESEKTAFIDLGIESGLSPGTEFIVYREGEIIKHPKTGEVLDVEQIITGRISITKVNRKFAIGEILEEEGDGIKYGQLVKSLTTSYDSQPKKQKAVQAPSKATQKEEPLPEEQQISPVVHLKQDKKKIRLAQEQGADYSETMTAPINTETHSAPVKRGPKNHVAVYPSAFDWEADVIEWNVNDRLPAVVENALGSIANNRTYTFTNLHKDKRLKRTGWSDYKPDRTRIINDAKEKGYDIVLMYYFSFREGQGLINGWGTDFMNPKFKAFLVDIGEGTVAVQKDTNTVALDQLFIELKSMTKQLLRETNFPQ